MEKQFLYQVKTTWKEGKIGIITSDVLDYAIEVATPHEFAKDFSGIWSPEHLLSAAVSSCFMATFLAVADKRKLDFKHFNCSSILILERVGGKLNAIQIALHPIVTISNSKDTARALKVLDITTKLCIIRAMLKPEIVVMSQIAIEAESTK